MDEFLSDAWFAALRRRVAQVTLATPLVVGVEVQRPAGSVRYQLELGDDGTDVTEPAPESGTDLTLVLDEEAAARLARGDVSAQQLLFDGRLQLRGDVRRLLELGDDIAPLESTESTADRRSRHEVRP